MFGGGNTRLFAATFTKVTLVVVVQSNLRILKEPIETSYLWLGIEFFNFVV